jgi:uncharacterized protein (TIGR04255 family)
MREMQLPSFKAPPVQEVAFAIRFSDVGLKTVHFGLLSQLLSKEYPHFDDLQPFGDESGIAFQIVPLPPFRRVRMSTEDRQHSVQIQGDRFIFNWTKTSKEMTYPRFGPLYRQFDELWNKFVDLLRSVGAGTPKVVSYDLTYVNELASIEGSVSSLAEHALSFFRWSGEHGRFLAEPTAMNAALTFKLPDENGQLLTSVNPATRADKQEVLLFILKCFGQPRAEREKWFQLAHEWIVRGFVDLTSTTAHKEWAREA